jgi:PIN domain nuclease of toxin-antitoxin system
MKVLIDTQSFIWFFEDNQRLPASVKFFMESSSLVVSIASFWEITIKTSLGKLAVPEGISGLIDKSLSKVFTILPIEREHLTVLSTLDLIHRDPFDRIIISQAIAENMPLVSSDEIFKQYPVNCIWKLK